MKKPKIIHRQWWAVLLLNLLSAAAVAADLGGFENPSSAFSWYSKGQGCIHFRLQNSSYVDGKYWRCMKKTIFYVKDQDGNRTDIFSIEERNTENGKGTATITNLQFSNSLLFLSNGYSVSYDYVGNPLGSTCIFKNNGGYNRPDGYVELDWFYPVALSGQHMTLGLDGELWLGGEEKRTSYVKDKLGAIEFDEITLETYDAFPATDASESGMLKIPFVSNCEINSAQASYTDEYGRQKTLQQVTLDKGMYSGFITVPATEVHRDLVITANVVSGKPNESDVRSDWPHELTGDVSVTVAKAPMVHAPRLLTSIVRADSACNTSVLLRWQIAHEDYPDALDGDAFLVQRSLTGRLDDFVEIGSVMFDSKRTEYSYDDDTFISSLTPELIDAKMGFPLVRYRVVRASTKELWAMSHNPAVAYTMPRPKPLVLAKPKGVKAAWSDEENRKVSVTWQYDLSDIEQSIPGVNRGGDCHYVWDDRASMRQLFVMPGFYGFTPDRTIGTDEDEYVVFGDGSPKYLLNEVNVLLTGNGPSGHRPADIVGAFVGDECRGVGIAGEPMQVWTLHGEEEQVHFRYYSAEKGGIYSFPETFVMDGAFRGDITLAF